MEQASIVPDGKGARSPTQSATELWARGMGEQVLQEWLGFPFGHVLEALCVDRVDEERLSAGDRVNTDHWMNHLAIG